jgi:OOP family OmpA-OmpF porin
MLLLAMLGFAASAAAQQRLYGGAGVGVSKTAMGENYLGITGATGSNLSRNDLGVGKKLFAGYQLNPNVAVEGGYVDLGKTISTRSMGTPAAGSIVMNSRSSGWFVDLTGMVPIGTSDVSLIGKVGRVASETSRTLSTSGTVTLAPGTATTYNDKESNWKYGAGAQYEINKSMIARGEVELYRKLGKEGNLGENDVGLFSVNLLIKFH